jgi:hypothetical protein
MERLEVIAMVDDYVYGFAMRDAAVAEAGTFDEVPGALVEYIDAQLATGEYPHIEELAGRGDTREVFGRLMATIFDETRFERGLDRLLDGIALEVERRVGGRR